MNLGAVGDERFADGKEGMPKELVEALKVGHKEVQAALKKKDAEKEPKDCLLYTSDAADE